MRNVVLPRETVEQVRDFMYPRVFDLQGVAWAPARALLAALDAALAAPEPWERNRDYEYIVRRESANDVVLMPWNPGQVWFEFRDRPTEQSMCSTTLTAAEARAVALALLEITEATP